jgi:hypothetical protein
MQTQQCELINLLLFFQNKESRLEMVGNTSWKKYHEKRRCRLEDNIEINFGEMCVCMRACPPPQVL